LAGVAAAGLDLVLLPPKKEKPPDAFLAGGAGGGVGATLGFALLPKRESVDRAAGFFTGAGAGAFALGAGLLKNDAFFTGAFFTGAGAGAFALGAGLLLPPKKEKEGAGAFLTGAGFGAGAGALAAGLLPPKKEKDGAGAFFTGAGEGAAGSFFGAGLPKLNAGAFFTGAFFTGAGFGAGFFTGVATFLGAAGFDSNNDERLKVGLGASFFARLEFGFGVVFLTGTGGEGFCFVTAGLLPTRPLRLNVGRGLEAAGLATGGFGAAFSGAGASFLELPKKDPILSVGRGPGPRGAVLGGVGGGLLGRFAMDCVPFTAAFCFSSHARASARAFSAACAMMERACATFSASCAAAAVAAVMASASRAAAAFWSSLAWAL